MLASVLHGGMREQEQRRVPWETGDLSRVFTGVGGFKGCNADAVYVRFCDAYFSNADGAIFETPN